MSLKKILTLDEFLQAQDPVDNFMKINLAIFPTPYRVEVNDKACKVLFNLSQKGFSNLVDDGKRQHILEMRDHKKHGKILSNFKLQYTNGYSADNPFTEFDRAVFSAYLSEFVGGKTLTTNSIIYRSITGKIGDSDANPSCNQAAAISSSLDKMMFTMYDPDISDAFEKMNYPEETKIILKSVIIPGNRVTCILNGKLVADVIFFGQQSPLLTIAKRKNNQLLTYDSKLLNVPNQNNTPLTIMLKNYSIRRIQEIKAHRKQMYPTLTFDDIFSKCRIENANRKVKLDARNSLIAFMEYLKNEGELKSFDVVKSGNTFSKIKLGL